MTLYVPAATPIAAAPDGPNPPPPDLTPTQRVRAAADRANRLYPRPFSFTRLSEEEEKTCSEVDIPRIRNLAGRKQLHRPVLWVDGPMDLFMTALAVVVRGNTSHRVRVRLENHFQTDWARERWDAALERVQSLPGELLTTGSGHAIKLLAPGLIKNAIKGKAKEIGAALRSDVRTLTAGEHILLDVNTENRTQKWDRAGKETTAWTSVDAGTRDLRERVNKLAVIKPLMTATGNIRSSDHRHNDWQANITTETAELVRRLGPTRADLQFAIGCFEYYSLGLERSGSGFTHHPPSEYLNLDFGHYFSRLATIRQLIRDIAGNEEWTDPEELMLQRVILGISGVISFTTFDIVCRAPVREQAGSIQTQVKSSLEDLMNSPSVEWGDGTSFFFTDSIEVDPKAIKDAIENPAKVLETKHVETRRVMLRMVGAERILASVKAEPVAEDDFGRLFVLPNGSQFVIVQNGTPEADGTRREYILGAIGNKHKSPRSAVASTFGLSEEQFFPALQT